MMRVLELENHRGETPLFLASVAGNPVCSCCFYIATHADAQAAVDALLQSGVDYTSAYMPDIKVPSHAPAFARIQVSPHPLLPYIPHVAHTRTHFSALPPDTQCPHGRQDLVSAARDYQEQIVQRAEPRRGVAVGTNSLLSRLLVVTRRRSANANASAALLASLRASPPGALMVRS